MSGLGLVRVERLSRRFGPELALSRVDLELPPGSATLLVGGNGSGKTTLLSVLSTELRPTRGEVFFGDQPWSEADEALRSQIGVVGHQPMLYRELSGRENLRFFARLYRCDFAAVERVLSMVAMEEAAGRPVANYSRGMIQRLALARALLHSPALLLLDEPFTGLDEQGCASLLEALATHKAGGNTLLVATHQPRALFGLCDRWAQLDGGRLVGAGTLSPGGEEVLSMSARDAEGFGR